MICGNCQYELSNDDIEVEFAAHDKSLLDIIITCPECQRKINTFCSEQDMVVLEEGQ